MGRPLLQNGGQTPIALKKEHMPECGVGTRQALQRCGYVPHAAQSTGHAEYHPPLGKGTSRAHRVSGQTRELSVSHGPRGENVPGVPPQLDEGGKELDILVVPHGLAPHTGGVTGPPGMGGAVATAAKTSSFYKGPAYPEGFAAASVVRFGGAYGWC